jgi:hypothetical protein
MLKLTSSERQSLVGPLVVGCVIGACVGLVSWGFDSEDVHIDHWRKALNVLIAFLESIAVAVVPLGVLPIAIQRLQRRRQPVANEEQP